MAGGCLPPVFAAGQSHPGPGWRKLEAGVGPVWELAVLAGVFLFGAAWWLAPVCYVALGDSLAAGVGSPLFFGYVQRFRLLAARRLRRPVRLTNLGRFGWTSGELLAALRQDARFREAVARADLISLDIGGNDLRRCGDDEACLERALAAFQANWEAIWAEVRSLNGEAVCLALNLYNPYPAGHPRRPLADRWVGAVNAAMADPDVLARYRIQGVGDAFALFRGRECRYCWICLLGDVHPTDLGHAALAGAVDAVYAPVAGRGGWLRRWLGQIAFPLWAIGRPWAQLDAAEAEGRAP